jgi:hypothetical protein
MTPESAALRQSIRDGLISAQIDAEEFEWTVQRVYELERQHEQIPFYGHAVISKVLPP